jgi:hypothetical protein
MTFLQRLMCWMLEKACSNVQGLKWQFTFSQEHVNDYIVVTQKYVKLKGHFKHQCINLFYFIIMV